MVQKPRTSPFFIPREEIVLFSREVHIRDPRNNILLLLACIPTSVNALAWRTEEKTMGTVQVSNTFLVPPGTFEFIKTALDIQGQDAVQHQSAARRERERSHTSDLPALRG